MSELLSFLTCVGAALSTVPPPSSTHSNYKSSGGSGGLSSEETPPIDQTGQPNRDKAQHWKESRASQQSNWQHYDNTHVMCPTLTTLLLMQKHQTTKGKQKLQQQQSLFTITPSAPPPPPLQSFSRFVGISELFALHHHHHHCTPTLYFQF